MIAQFPVIVVDRVRKNPKSNPQILIHQIMHLHNQLLNQITISQGIVIMIKSSIKSLKSNKARSLYCLSKFFKLKFFVKLQNHSTAEFLTIFRVIYA